MENNNSNKPVPYSNIASSDDSGVSQAIETRIKYVVLHNTMVAQIIEPNGGVRHHRLVNGVIRIEKVITVHDRTTRNRFLEIRVTHEDGTDLGTKRIRVEEFKNLNWLQKEFYPKIIPSAHPHTHGLLREAIQTLSPNPTDENVYAHIGWIHSHGKSKYLHAGGAISEFGPEAVGVKLSGALEDYRLELPSDKSELIEAVEASFDLLKLAPLSVTVPLLAAYTRSVLCDRMLVDYVLLLIGPTGVGKTALLGVYQALFGRNFNQRNLPANWQFTPNALQVLASRVKDAPLPIDDFALNGSRGDINMMLGKAEKTIRGIRNHAGTGRLTADIELREQPRPQGMVVGSAEVRPSGRSLQAGIFSVDMKPGDVKFELLTRAQYTASRGLLSKAMGAYIRYLAAHFTKYTQDLHGRHIKFRAEATKPGLHPRTPDIVASLAVGYESFLLFALHSNAINFDTKRTFWREGWEVLCAVAAAQEQHHSEQDPVMRFIDLLRALLISGQAHLESGEGKGLRMPNNPSLFGWKVGPRGTYAGGNRIGWVTSSEVWLQDDVAFAEVQRLSARQGLPLPITPGSLWKQLAQRGYLIASGAEGKWQSKRTPPGMPRARFRILPISIFQEEKDNDTCDGTVGTHTAADNPESRSLNPSDAEELH